MSKYSISSIVYIIDIFYIETLKKFEEMEIFDILY